MTTDRGWHSQGPWTRQGHPIGSTKTGLAEGKGSNRTPEILLVPQEA